MTPIKSIVTDQNLGQLTQDVTVTRTNFTQHDLMNYSLLPFLLSMKSVCLAVNRTNGGRDIVLIDTIDF